MIKITDYMQVQIDTDSPFEQDIISAMVKAYNAGRRHKRSMLNVIDSDGSEWMSLECDNEGKAALTTIVSAFGRLLDSHDRAVKDKAIAQYKKEHGIKE